MCHTCSITHQMCRVSGHMLDSFRHARCIHDLCGSIVEASLIKHTRHDHRHHPCDTMCPIHMRCGSGDMFSCPKSPTKRSRQMSEMSSGRHRWCHDGEPVHTHIVHIHNQQVFRHNQDVSRHGARVCDLVTRIDWSRHTLGRGDSSTHGGKPCLARQICMVRKMDLGCLQHEACFQVRHQLLAGVTPEQLVCTK